MGHIAAKWSLKRQKGCIQKYPAGACIMEPGGIVNTVWLNAPAAKPGRTIGHLFQGLRASPPVLVATWVLCGLCLCIHLRLCISRRQMVGAVVLPDVAVPL